LLTSNIAACAVTCAAAAALSQLLIAVFNKSLRLSMSLLAASLLQDVRSPMLQLDDKLSLIATYLCTA
jgi:hypothetical protein